MLTANTYKNISSLVRLLTILAVLSAIAIVSLTGLGMNRIYSRQVIQMAEEESVLISRLLVDHNLETLISRNEAGKPHLQIDPLEVESLDSSFGDFLKSLDIVKVKIFTPDTRVIYSSELQLIGETNPDNQRLQRALTGETDSHLEMKDQLRDLKNETVLNVDVVETYIPIMAQSGEILGAFELYMDVTKFRDEVHAGTLSSLLLLSTVLLLVYLAAYSVARIGMKRAAEAEEQLRKQAMIDTLTGVLNRGELMSRAEKEISRIERSEPDRDGKSLSLVMLDIDNFKLINDDHGHQAGDKILSQLAARIQKQLRPYDILGRYGGEEFLLLLPETSLSRAMQTAERIRACIADKPFKDGNQPLKVTISIGVSSANYGIKLTEAIKVADQALYSAKLNGRNRVEQQHHA
jgi:diguanylate cyclase (GGDEF)-like protein